MARSRDLAKRPRSYADVEEEAYSVRQALRFSSRDPLPSVELFESLGGYGAGSNNQIPVEYAVKELPMGVEAETRFIPNQDLGVIEIVLSEKTYDLLEFNQPRARFSLAHEIGHAALHSEELIERASADSDDGVLSRMQDRLSIDIPAYQDMEWQANAFASALLMPVTALVKLDGEGKLCVENLCQQFAVSRTCARIRLELFQKKRDQLIRRIVLGKTVGGK